MITITEILRLLPPEKRNCAKIWAGYSLLWTPLLASAAGAKASVTTSDDSDFIAMSIASYSTTNAVPPVENATPQWTFTLQIGSNQLFPDGNPVHGAMFTVSTAYRRGRELDYPIYIPAQQALVALANNLTAVDMINKVTIFGLRILNFEKGSTKF